MLRCYKFRLQRSSCSQRSRMAASSATTQPMMQNDPKKLVEYLLGDLRLLSTEAKKKHNHVKEAAESGIVKVRNISTSSSNENLSRNLRSACSEIIHPLILGCSSKNPRLVQISLQAIQRMLQFRNSSPVIVNELWHLTEAQCEELRVLQTVTPFVSADLLVKDFALSKCIVLAIKLNFSKDASVINAASAAVRQLFSCVFERVVQEDGLNRSEKPTDDDIKAAKNVYASGNNSQANLVSPTLRPCAADGYLLLKDLVLLIRGDNPQWLKGVHKIAKTLALELMESILKSYPSIFYKHSEYADLLYNQICPQLVRIFVGEKEGSLDNSNGCDGGADVSRLSLNGHHDIMAAPVRPKFPILIRSLRISLVLLTNYHSLLIKQNEVIIGFLLELTYSEGFVYQTAMALEVLHKIVVQPNLLFWLCENYECRTNTTKLIRLLLQSIVSYIKKALDEGYFIPLYENLSQKRWMLLEWLEKHEPGPVPEGYCISVAYTCLVDCTHAIYAAVEESMRERKTSSCNSGEDETHLEKASDGSTSEHSVKRDKEAVSRELFMSSYRYLLDGFSTLLDCSVDDSITDAILNSYSTIVTMACRLGKTTESKELSLRTICQAALPPGYFQKFIETSTPSNMNSHNALSADDVKEKDSASSFLPSSPPRQVVAMGTICPIPSLQASMYNTSVMLTAKNMQVSRLLIACAQQNGHLLTDCWDMVLTALQHLVWILGMKPTSAATFRTGGDTSSSTTVASSLPNVTGGAGSTSLNGSVAATSGGDASSGSVVFGNNPASASVILTTVVSSELPDLNLSLNRLFESTTTFDDVGLHHVIAALCKLSSESMMVAQMTSRETSFFAVAKLLQTALVNLQRLEVFWKPVTAHLLEICGHSNVNLREWGSVALTSLVKSAMKQLAARKKAEQQQPNGMNVDAMAKSEQFILTPLASISEIDYVDVKTKQLDCLMHVLQSDSHDFRPQIWPLIIRVVSAIVSDSTDAQLIGQGYRTLSLIVKDFLSVLPFGCMEMLVETNAGYGKQQVDLNVSLSAVGQLWDISDYVRRESVNRTEQEVEQVWLVLYNCLSELCVDARPPVRKSACDTLLQTVAAHGQALRPSTWSQMVSKILFPMLDKVYVLSSSASTQPTNSSALGASNIMIHHSRDTESKQWAETTVKTLSGVVKIFNSQRSILVLLDYIELISAADNSEISLAALKNFQELLVGRQQQAADVRQGERSSGVLQQEDESVPQLPERLWIASWNSWLRIAQSITSPIVNCTEPPINHLSSRPELDKVLPPERKWKTYVPGPFHLTTLLNVFTLLFRRVGCLLTVDEMCFLAVPTIFKSISSIPLSSTDQSPFFVLNSENAELSSTQECILECVRTVVQEQLDPQSKLNVAIPDTLTLLLGFVEYAIRPPRTEFRLVSQSSSVIAAANATSGAGAISRANDAQFQWAKQSLITFAELSLRTAVEYYSKVAAHPEVIQRTVFVDIIKCLAEPLALKYDCPNQSTWKIAATSLIQVCQIGLPIARANLATFTDLWMHLGDAIKNFLFTKSKSVIPLNAEERKRHEFLDCLIIELLGKEVLPYAGTLPRDFMEMVIGILNRGSINTMDVNDVMASDSFQHRADLSRACFDALLSMSGGGGSTSSPSTAAISFGDGQQSPSASLGASAIGSLLKRCQEVLNNYARDEQGSGHFRLPQERIFETLAVLRAISTLIEGLAKRTKDAPHSTLYANLVGLYPSVVQLVPSCKSDKQIELTLMTALHSYETLLLINVHKY